MPPAEVPEGKQHALALEKQRAKRILLPSDGMADAIDATTMRSPLPEVRLVSAIQVLAALALVGCHPSSDHNVGASETTIVLGGERTSVAALPAFVPEVPSTGWPYLPQSPGDLGVTSMQGEPDADIYASPPLHETNGSSRYSDVGMPYPIPSADFDPMPPPTTVTAPPAAPPPFPETSFRPPYVSQGFPESSFGPDPEP